jgi:hypothetical protein
MAAEARVEEFISANQGLDTQAADALRSTSREVQTAVLDRGAVTGRNRSVVLIRRIRQAEEALMESTNLEGQLEQLCATVDSHAGSALRGSTREVQRAVLRQGSVAGSKNPSAKLISRIREAEDEKLPADLSGRVAALIDSAGIDSHARTVLTSASSRVQRAVVAQGSLAGAKNPSAKLIARVRDAEDSLDMPEDIGGRIEYLTNTPGVDSAAAKALRSASKAVQTAVCKQGPLTGATNPSGNLMSRIREVEGSVVPEDLEARVAHIITRVDAAAAKALKSAPTAIQLDVVSQGTLTGNDPSKILLSRIRRAEAQRLPSDDRLQILLSTVDAQAAAALRSAPAAVRAEVLRQGALSGKNPSGVLMSRIKIAYQNTEKGGSPAETKRPFTPGERSTPKAANENVAPQEAWKPAGSPKSAAAAETKRALQPKAKFDGEKPPGAPWAPEKGRGAANSSSDLEPPPKTDATAKPFPKDDANLAMIAKRFDLPKGAPPPPVGAPPPPELKTTAPPPPASRQLPPE